jgi:hypothetical protein
MRLSPFSTKRISSREAKNNFGDVIGQQQTLPRKG